MEEAEAEAEAAMYLTDVEHDSSLKDVVPTASLRVIVLIISKRRNYLREEGGVVYSIICMP